MDVRHARPMMVAMMAAILSASPAAADGVKVETVLEGLTDPCGVAIWLGSSAARYDVFVAESGAGRIVKMPSDRPGESTQVVTGFATGASGSERFVTADGPRGMLFLSRRHLLVVGNRPDGDHWIRLYELPEDGESLKADRAKRHVEWRSAEGDADGVRFHSLARTQINDRVPDMVVVSARGATRGGLWKTLVRAGMLGDLAPFADDEEQSPVGTPGGVAVSRKGFLVVGWKDGRDEPTGSTLVFYNPIDAAPVLRLHTELDDPCSLIYSKVTGNLYAADFAPHNPPEGGVFRIDDASRPGKPGCRAVRLATVTRPTALAFGSDGALYVTACGPAAGQGMLVRLTAEDEAL